MKERPDLTGEIVTRLIHRSTRLPSPWWHSTTVLAPKALFSPETAGIILDEARFAVSLGFESILVEPGSADVLVRPDSGLGAFVEALHSLGLRVVLRVPSDTLSSLGVRALDMDDRTSALLARTRGAIAAGADGIDLGVCQEEESSSPIRAALARQRFATLVRLVEAEAASSDSQPIVTARIADADPERIRHHLEEYWFHHLRDDSLRDAGWSAEAIRQALVSSLAERDPLGAVMPWSFDVSRSALLRGPGSGIGSQGWEPGLGAEAAQAGSPEDEGETARERALFCFAASLPGVVHAVCRGEKHDDGIGRGASPDAAVERALRLRSERGLGTGNLGLVDGCEWAHTGASVHVNGSVMVVLNTSAEEVVVPSEYSPLLSSSAVEGGGGPTPVPPECCAWFEMPVIRPAPLKAWS